MWLEAGEDIDDLIPGSRLVQGERILMEVSRKFTQEKLRGLAFQSGFFWQASSPATAATTLPAVVTVARQCMLQMFQKASVNGMVMQIELLTSAASRDLHAV